MSYTENDLSVNQCLSRDVGEPCVCVCVLCVNTTVHMHYTLIIFLAYAITAFSAKIITLLRPHVRMSVYDVHAERAAAWVQHTAQYCPKASEVTTF